MTLELALLKGSKRFAALRQQLREIAAALESQTGIPSVARQAALIEAIQTDKRKRVTPFSDRDFQLRVGALWPVAVATGTPLAFWRNDSSVDAGRYS